MPSIEGRNSQKVKITFVFLELPKVAGVNIELKWANQTNQLVEYKSSKHYVKLYIMMALFEPLGTINLYDV